jgi:predicted ATP-grasp superfamily ATP-dependent carboligase
VVALSARALSASARRAGYVPLAADLFGDLDLQAMAAASVRVDGGLGRGLEWAPLGDALAKLAGGRSPVGLVCGSGFEDRPALLARLGERWPLFGNRAEAVERAKDPRRLAELCARLSIPHPRLSEGAPTGPGWISKRRGAAGGSHVSERGGGGPATYWQERVAGEPFAALVLGARNRAIVLGLSAQWTDPAPEAPFRYGGAVRPAALRSDLRAALENAARSVVEASGLIGLNSVDFLVGEDGWHLLEINPRPGATLDIFEPATGSLFGLHVAACQGELPAEAPRLAGAAAASIVHARRAVPAVPEFAWPDWAADRQPPRTSVAAGAPLCTVLARAPTAAEARRLVEARAGAIRTALGAG